MATPLIISGSEVGAWVGSFFWPFMRIGMMLTIMPVFGGRLVPVRARIVAALVITMAVMPLVPPVPAIDPFSIPGVLISVQQIFIGLAMGFAMQMVFAALVIAGQSMAMSMGLGFAAMVDPQNGVQVPVVSQYFIIMSTLLFLSMNGHLIMIEVLANSFQTMPIAAEGLTRQGIRELVGWAAQMFAGGLMVALPAVTALLMVNIAFGVVTRAAPQMNIFAVGFPVTMTLGFVILFSTTTSLAPQMEILMQDSIELMIGLTQGDK